MKNLITLAAVFLGPVAIWQLLDPETFWQRVMAMGLSVHCWMLTGMVAIRPFVKVPKNKGNL